MITTESGYTIFFDKGKFDEFCVYVSKNGYKKAPLDKEYFTWLVNLSKEYGTQKVYNDFLTIYKNTKYVGDEDKIYEICCDVDSHYDEDTVHWWLIFVFTMYAEDMKKNAILGKRIKHLAVYNLLFDSYDIDYTMKYMRGKRWKYLDKLMEERGI